MNDRYAGCTVLIMHSCFICTQNSDLKYKVYPGNILHGDSIWQHSSETILILSIWCELITKMNVHKAILIAQH